MTIDLVRGGFLESERKGFSFIQILVILAVVAAIFGGAVYLMKPSQVLEKSRDTSVSAI